MHIPWYVKITEWATGLTRIGAWAWRPVILMFVLYWMAKTTEELSPELDPWFLKLSAILGLCWVFYPILQWLSNSMIRDWMRKAKTVRGFKWKHTQY